MSERSYTEMLGSEPTPLPQLIRKRIKEAFDVVLPMAENSLKIEAATDSKPFTNITIRELAASHTPLSIASALQPLDIIINEGNAKSTTDEYLNALKFHIGKLGNFVDQMNNYQVDLDPKAYDDIPFDDKYAGLALQMCFIAEELSTKKNLDNIEFDECAELDPITKVGMHNALVDQRAGKPPIRDSQENVNSGQAESFKTQISHLKTHFEDLILKSERKPSYIPEEGIDLRYSTLFEEFRQEKKNSSGKNGWNDPRNRTEEGHILEKDTFISCAGDKDINLITREDCHKYRITLLDRPKDYKKNRHTSMEEYKHKNPDYETIKLGTASKRSKLVVQFLQWCKDHQLNYLKGDILLKPIEDTDDDDDDATKRDPFSYDQLKLIFSQPTWAELKFTNDYHYWAPLIAAYSGARGTEICQLHKEHIIKDPEGSGYAIVIEKDKKLGTRVKSDSDRTIPLHGDLISLNFIEFLEKTKTSALFPKLWKKTKDGKPFCDTRNMQQRFNQALLTNLNIKSPKLSFHSFRHSFGDIAMEQGVLPEFVDMIRGHKRSVGGQSPTSKLYGSKHKLGAIRRPYLDNFKLQNVMEEAGVKPWSGKIKNGI